MCGRTCCTLDPNTLSRACQQVTKSRPVYLGSFGNGGSSKNAYSPSTNIPPSCSTPVLCKGSQLATEHDYVLKPMVWGIVPHWLDAEQVRSKSNHGLTTNNARLESIRDSKLYKKPIENSQRCVVVCDGFYEWKTNKEDKNLKQPYFVYAKQKEDHKIEDLANYNIADESDNDWEGPRPLFMAGLYSLFNKDSFHNNPLYSYTVITRESNKEFDWLHHRVPAILRNHEEIEAWLNPETKSFDALKILKPIEKGDLQWHPVGKDVGSVKNQSESLNRPVELDDKGQAKVIVKKNALTNWLIKKEPKKEVMEPVKEETVDEELSEPPAKVAKI